MMDKINLTKSNKGGNKVFDYSKLKGRMAEAGVNQKALSEAVGVSENTISDKLQHGNGFKPDHVLKICKKLNISIGEIGLYFFNR